MEERKYTGPYLYYISSKSNSSSYARVCYYHNLTYEQRLSPTPWILRKGTAEDYQLTAAHLPRASASWTSTQDTRLSVHHNAAILSPYVLYTGCTRDFPTPWYKIPLLSTKQRANKIHL